MKNILCYGDSNTWGAIPGVLRRFDPDVRWTGVLAKALGSGYQIHEDGINGRRTVWDDPVNPCRNGLDALGYALYRTKPLDLVVVMLGTNDLNHTDAEGYYLGLSVLCRRILAAGQCFPGTSEVFPNGPKLLIVSPIRTSPTLALYENSCKFAEQTRRLAEELNVPWFDAASVAEPSDADGCHMAAESHKKLGLALEKVIREILPEA